MSAQQQEYTKYEVARILGARALQISMDAPIILKISEEDLEKINYDPIRIAEKEFDSGVLPISIHRPLPKTRESKLQEVKEEKIDDEKIIAKEKEIEEEFTEKAAEEGFVEEDDESGLNGDDESDEER